MGQLNVAEINPVTAVANGVKAVCHDCSVFVCNACNSECNGCGCWQFGVQTFEPHEDSSESSSDSSHCCGECRLICGTSVITRHKIKKMKFQIGID